MVAAVTADRTSADIATGIEKAGRIVVKIGSALLIDDVTGALRRDWLRSFAADVAALREREQEVAIVSSGAIAFGRRQLDLTGQALALEEKQAAAAVGQIHLAHAWQEALAAHGLTLAQILLSLSDTEERRRHLNARETLTALFRFGAVPLINENDTVATEEIRFGDNDRLAARVAQMVSADLLVLLSDIDGLYDRDPRLHDDARHIADVPALTDDIRAMAGKPRPGYSSGGMVTKLEAARIAVGAGCAMIISDGRAGKPDPAARGRRAPHKVRAGRQPRHSAQTLDRRRAGRRRADYGRRRRGARTAPGQEPAAGRRHGGRGPVPARRRRAHPGAGRRRNRHRPDRLRRRRRPQDRRLPEP